MIFFPFFLKTTDLNWGGRARNSCNKFLCVCQWSYRSGRWIVDVVTSSYHNKHTVDFWECSRYTFSDEAQVLCFYVCVSLQYLVMCKTSASKCSKGPRPESNPGPCSTWTTWSPTETLVSKDFYHHWLFSYDFVDLYLLFFTKFFSDNWSLNRRKDTFYQACQY